MSTNQFISVRETAQLLAISEKKVMDLIEERKLQAYRIADKFLRLKKSEVLELKNSGNVAQETEHFGYTPAERIKDFFYFNDFYIVAAMIIIVLLFVIFYT
jgi:excisionase family DNA binding protein